jgi:hypothetical protein
MKGFTAEQQAFVKAAIKEAYDSGKKDGGKEAARESPYHLTEKRLYAIPDLEDRIDQWNKDIEEIEIHGHAEPRRSRDIVLLTAGGRGITSQDRVEALVRKKEAEVESDERELRTMRRALSKIEGDEYYQVIQLHYIEKVKDDREKAVKMDVVYTSSIYKNRVRLVRRLAVILYGSAALK